MSALVENINVHKLFEGLAEHLSEGKNMITRVINEWKQN